MRRPSPWIGRVASQPMWQRTCMPRRALPLLLAATLLVAGCSDTSGGEGSDDTAAVSTSPTTESGPTTTAPQDAILTDSLRCDPLDEQGCLLPWPNDAFTVPDPSTATGRRLDLHPDSTPKNVDGVPIDVTDQNLADGFSPGSAILAFAPGLDVIRTGIAPSTDIGASLADDAPIVLLDTGTGERIPYWAELDAPAPPGQQVLMVHPAISLPEGHHIEVALRAMKDAAGADIPRSPAFQAAIDGTPEPLERARHLGDVLGSLSDAGVAIDDLYLAWDFTVASTESLSGRMLHIRDDAYASLATDGAPAFRVTSQTDSGNVRTIDGEYDIPNYLDLDAGPGSKFVLGADGMPERNSAAPTVTASFHCLVPLTATGAHPSIVYGHGLLGTRHEVDALSFAPQSNLATACATDEIGMSSDDIGYLATILADLSLFNRQADRMQQGLLAQQFLGRLLNSAAGFASSPAFQAADGTPLIDVGNTVFVGNSQGGILGGAASAVSSEWHRVVLGVPGIDYSLLLPRSSDWPQFQRIFDVAYTDPIDRLLGLQLIQLLWDRGENDGYAQHLTSGPYPGIDAKQVLLVQAFGDHQVSNVSTDILARTLGATVYEPALTAGRSNDVDPQWGIGALDPTSPTAAIMVVWDFGTPAPPPVNLPPTEPEFGKDPHGAGSDEPRVLQQAFTFLLTGEFSTSACGGNLPCVSDVLSGAG